MKLHPRQKVVRSHPLTEDELGLLERHAARIRERQFSYLMSEDFRPLLTTVYEAVEKLHCVSHLGYKIKDQEGWYRARKNCIMWCVLRGMVEHRTGYWCWSEKEWRDAITGLPKRQSLVMFAVAYLLDVKAYRHYKGPLSLHQLYRMIFGEEAWDEEIEAVSKVLQESHFSILRSDGRGHRSRFNRALAYALLDVGGKLNDVTHESLLEIQKREGTVDYLPSVSQALFHLGVISQPLEERRRRGALPLTSQGVSVEWLATLGRWEDVTVGSKSAKSSTRWACLKAGRWLNQHYPNVTRLEDWTPEVTADFVAAVDKMKVGDYTSYEEKLATGSQGKPLAPRSKRSLIVYLRSFFTACKRKRLVERLNIDPSFDLATPDSIENLIGPDPRDIEEDKWLRLVWASLDLNDDDCKGFFAPPRLTRSLAVLWTHSGLRFDEIRRLSVGCVRQVSATLWEEDGTVPEVAELVCELTVPAHKTGNSFVKPVPIAIEGAVRAWEAVRGNQPKKLDRKTGKSTDFLFMYRGKRITLHFMNNKLIPLLCKKAGIKNYDHRGPYTSHRGRASIASALYNSKAGMSLEELKRWLGHRSVESTQNYVRPYGRVQNERFAEIRALNSLDAILTDEERQGSFALVESEPIGIKLDTGGYCLSPLHDRCTHKGRCGGCEFHLEQGPVEKILAIERMLLSLSDATGMDEGIQEKVTEGLTLLRSLLDVPLDQ